MRRVEKMIALVLVMWLVSSEATGQIGGARLVDRAIDFDEPRQRGTIRGVVFHDRNGTRSREAGEPGIPGVLVSNGRTIVRTNERGEYRIKIDESGGIVFACKPRGYRPAVDEHFVPRVSYVHKPEGSPADLDFPGVPPTGRLPDRVDIPLVEWVEPDRPRIAIIGDPQPRDERELDWMARRVIGEMTGLGVEGVISLGDIMFDDLSLYREYDKVMAGVGAPIYNVHGNHDLNFDVETDELSDETWERVYGPTNYALQIGTAHFVVLDNVVYQGEQSGQQYDGHFNDDALAFLQSYMRHVPKHELLVVAFHIPLFDVDNLDEFLQILGRHPHTLSLSAHWHVQRHVYYAGEDGWSGVSSTANNHLHHKPGDEMRHHSHDIHPHDHSLHHHLCHATACGSWWRGAPGGDGIPHALMRDGTPQGFSILTVEPDGAYEIDYKASGRPTEAQLHIWMPEPLTAAAIARQEAEVVVNVWAGSPRDRVEMRVLRTAPGRRPHVTGWVELAHDVRPDPYYLEAKALEDAIKAKLPEGESLAWREMPSPVDAHHIWSAPVPVGLSEGAYVLLVRWTDQWGREHESRRVLRIEP